MQNFGGIKNYHMFVYKGMFDYKGFTNRICCRLVALMCSFNLAYICWLPVKCSIYVSKL